MVLLVIIGLMVLYVLLSRAKFRQQLDPVSRYRDARRVKRREARSRSPQREPAEEGCPHEKIGPCCA